MANESIPQDIQIEESLTLDGGDPRYLYVTSATKVGDIDRALNIWKKIQPSSGEERSFVNQNVQKLEAGRRKIINYANSKVGKMSEENKYKLAKLIADKTYKYVSIDAVNRLLPHGEQGYVDENELNGKQGLMWDILEGKTGVDYMTVVKSTLAISGIALLSEMGAFSAIATGFGMLATFNPVIAACAAVLGAATVIKYARQLFAPEIKKLIARHKTEKQFATLMDMEGFKDELGSPEKLDEFMNTYGNGAPPKKEDKGDGNGTGKGDGGKYRSDDTGKGDGDGTGKGDDNGTGKGDGDGTGKGDDNGKGTGNGTGKGDDDGKGTGDGTGKGDDNGKGTGDGTGKGDDNGKGTGDGTGKGDDNGKGTGDGTGKGDDNGKGTGDGTGKGDDTGKGDGDGTGKGDDNGKGQPIITYNEAPTWETQFKEIVSEIDANMEKLDGIIQDLVQISVDVEKATTPEQTEAIHTKRQELFKSCEVLQGTIESLQSKGKALINQNVAKKTFKNPQKQYLLQLKIDESNDKYTKFDSQYKLLTGRLESKEFDAMRVQFGDIKFNLQNKIDQINEATKTMKTPEDVKEINALIVDAKKLYGDLETIESTLKSKKQSTRDLGLQGIKTKLDNAIKDFNKAKAKIPNEQTTENEQPGEDNNGNKGNNNETDKGDDNETNKEENKNQAQLKDPEAMLDSKRDITHTYNNIRMTFDSNPADPKLNDLIDDFKSKVKDFKAKFKNIPGFEKALNPINSCEIQVNEIVQKLNTRTQQPVENQQSDKSEPAGYLGDGKKEEKNEPADEENKKPTKKGLFDKLANFFKFPLDKLKELLSHGTLKKADESAQKLSESITKLGNLTNDITNALQQGKDASDLVQQFKDELETIKRDYHPDIFQKLIITLKDKKVDKLIERAEKNKDKKSNNSEKETDQDNKETDDKKLGLGGQIKLTYLQSQFDSSIKKLGIAWNDVAKHYATIVNASKNGTDRINKDNYSAVRDAFSAEGRKANIEYQNLLYKAQEIAKAISEMTTDPEILKKLEALTPYKNCFGNGIKEKDDKGQETIIPATEIYSAAIDESKSSSPDFMLKELGTFEEMNPGLKAAYDQQHAPKDNIIKRGFNSAKEFFSHGKKESSVNQEAEAPTQPNEPSELDNFISYVKQSVQTYLGASSDARAQGTSRSKIQKDFANKVQEILKTHPESKDIVGKLQTYFSEIESYVETINKSNSQSGVTKSDKVIETGKIQAAKNAGLDKATLEALGIDPNSLEGNDGPGNNG